MDFAIKYLSDPVCPAFGPVRSRVSPFSYLCTFFCKRTFTIAYFQAYVKNLFFTFCKSQLLILLVN